MSAPGDDNDMSSDAKSAAPASAEKIGLAAWMSRAATELDRTRQDFNPDAVHDLRVALRRCMAIADLHMALDPLEAWGEMRKIARRLFKPLGDLRDVQVMEEWIGHLAGAQDPAAIRLRTYLGDREVELRKLAAEGVASFNRTNWLKLQNRLAKRSLSLPLEDEVFQQFALERWQAAHDQHRQALRNRSRVSFHRLRIGLKRFRYTVENFLPHRHELWGGDLRLLQDVLGELHDLFVLWRTALHIGVLADRELRSRWHERIEEESRARLLAYRSKMVGKESLWPIWRARLPRDRVLQLAAEARIRIWASHRDPDFTRTLRVASLALQLFDGLLREGFTPPAGAEDIRSALYGAAIMYNVGTKAGGKKGGKSSYKRIRKTRAPLGFPAQLYALAALTARYRRGTIGRPKAKHLALFSETQKQGLRLIAAILCLADAFVVKDHHPIQRLKISRMADALVIFAAGYRQQAALARKLAAARHPLEVACRTPILIRPLPEGQ